MKRQKNDATDAEAICEAVTRPTMRFVPVKNEEQQSVLILHRVRELLIRQRTTLVNALRGHLAEFTNCAGIKRTLCLIACIFLTIHWDPAHDCIPTIADAARSKNWSSVSRRKRTFWTGTIASKADNVEYILSDINSVDCGSARHIALRHRNFLRCDSLMIRQEGEANHPINGRACRQA